MEILVLGGTRFFGKVLVTKLIDRGHNVTISTRGLTKDDYGNMVNRIVIDRENKDSIESALKGKSFDVIYDNICYSPNAADILCDIIKDKTEKYIVVSSSAVYDFNRNIKEEDFDPKQHIIRYGERDDFSYDEGKRQTEAVIYQNYSIPTISVRFPVVISEDDYTKRLYSYVEAVIKEESLNIDNLDSEQSFISAKDAGEFLACLCDKEYEGPINAACEGSITLREIINYIEISSNKHAQLNSSGKSGAYNGILDCSLDTSKAKNIGFKFNYVNEYVLDLIDKYLKQY
ncbi:MAG: NAD-dependent epimerase/dehydratase family protein [Clostridium sp.]